MLINHACVQPVDAKRHAILTTQASNRGTVVRAAGVGAVPEVQSADDIRDFILSILDDAKAEETVEIDLAGKTPMADYMIVTSGRSDRHVGAIAEQLRTKLKEAGLTNIRLEGLTHRDWVLVDAGDVIVHVFRPEVREFYNLEKMWSAPVPEDRFAG